MQYAVEPMGIGMQSVREWRASMIALETCARPACASGCTRDHDRPAQSQVAIKRLATIQEAYARRQLRIARYGDRG